MKKDFSQDDFLKILDKADRFTDWMYGEIKLFLKGDIFELGSGFGTYSKKVINDFPNNKIVLSDIDEGRINKLKELQSSNVSVSKIDISDRKDFEKIKASIDSAFALNVLEHIEDDISALNNVYDILSPGGTFVILVPAHRFLFNCIDKDAGHYRRYTKKSVSESISKTGFKIRKMFYFNIWLVPEWKYFKKPHDK